MATSERRSPCGLQALPVWKQVRSSVWLGSLGKAAMGSWPTGARPPGGSGVAAMPPKTIPAARTMRAMRVHRFVGWGGDPDLFFNGSEPKSPLSAWQPSKSSKVPTARSGTRAHHPLVALAADSKARQAILPRTDVGGYAQGRVPSGPPSRVDQAVGNGVFGEAGHGMNAQSAHDALAMGLDGADANAELGRRFPCCSGLRRWRRAPRVRGR